MTSLFHALSDMAREAVDALERINNSQPLTDSQAALVRPRLRRIADKDAIPFIHVGSFYLIGDGYFPDEDGFEYIRNILMSAQRVHQQDQYISSIELYSRGRIGEYGVDYIGDVSNANIDDDGNWITQRQKAGLDAFFPDSTKRLMVAEIKKLRGAGETPETNADLKFYEEELGVTTYQGRVKGFLTDEDRARQNVQRAIKPAKKKINDNPKTCGIGAHLQVHIRTGDNCRYTGKLRFRFQ